MSSNRGVQGGVLRALDERRHQTHSRQFISDEALKIELCLSIRTKGLMCAAPCVFQVICESGFCRRSESWCKKHARGGRRPQQRCARLHFASLSDWEPAGLSTWVPAHY